MNIKKAGIIVAISIFFIIPAFVSCEKKEPAVNADPHKILEKVLDEKKEYTPEGKIYKSGMAESPEELLTELYPPENGVPFDISKIEKYAFIIGGDGNEAGIFKAFDASGAEYMKKLLEIRILELHRKGLSPYNSERIKSSAAAEARSYGKYVYYAVSAGKDGIFNIIEGELNGNKNK